MRESDNSSILRERVLAAIANKTPLQIMGGNSKAFYGRSIQAEPLFVTEHSGIIHYEPTELVITARAGTPLTEIETALAAQGQMLAFEPPHFGTTATLGGTVACGLSGSRRPYAGAVRDVVLGVRLLNGHGDIVKFGGEVMKNVAGFDVSRLQVGALGTLGVLLDISLKVLPCPETEITLCFEVKESEALKNMIAYGKKNLPLSAMCFDSEKLYLRLSGAEVAIAKVKQQLGGETLSFPDSDAFWLSVREQQHPFFQHDLPLWRLSLAPATSALNLSGKSFIDWGGALRWLKTEEKPATVFSLLQNLAGHACLFRSATGCEFQPLTPELAKLHRNIKQAFDPHGIFNRGRLYLEM
jgi:glycolate oxidase FAD binding subunit